MVGLVATVVAVEISVASDVTVVDDTLVLVRRGKSRKSPKTLNLHWYSSSRR